MKTSFQFHGDRQEVARMVAQWALSSGTLLVEERFFPEYRLRLADELELNEYAELTDDVNRISLVPRPGNFNAVSALEFVQNNPSILVVHLGKQSVNVLKESLFSATADDPKIAKMWKNLRDQAKASMFNEAWVKNVNSDARRWLPGHFYTAKAKEIADSGIVLPGSTDWLVYEFLQSSSPA